MKSMLTDKEKKIGIIMLIVSAVLVVALIVGKIVFAKNGGIHGSGVSNGDESKKVVPVTLISTMFYDTTLGESRYDCSLSTPATLDVYADMVHDAEGAMAVAQEQNRQEEINAQQERKEASVDYSTPNAYTGALAFAMHSADVEGEGLTFDTKSVTGKFVPLTDVVSKASLALCNIFYDSSNLKEVRALEDGALAEGNSIQRFYSDIIVPNYTEGTYCAYLATEDSLTHLGGNELLILLLNYVPAEDVAKYIEDGETLDSLVESGKISLETAVSEGVGQFDNVYDMCNIGYAYSCMNPFGATEQLIVVHLVNGRVYKENYAVANLIGTSAEVDEESSNIDPESGEVIPNIKEVEVPMFTGYYCW